MVSSTGTFVSCKDYDDDIDRIDKELSEARKPLQVLTRQLRQVNSFSHVMRLPVDMNWFSLTVPKLLSRMVLMEQMVLLLSLNSVWKAITGRLAQTKVLLGWM